MLGCRLLFLPDRIDICQTREPFWWVISAFSSVLSNEQYCNNRCYALGVLLCRLFVKHGYWCADVLSQKAIRTFSTVVSALFCFFRGESWASMCRSLLKAVYTSCDFFPWYFAYGALETNNLTLSPWFWRSVAYFTRKTSCSCLIESSLAFLWTGQWRT